jgi:hypothetical protein
MTYYFRGKPCCYCLYKWLPVYERELQETGNLVGELQIYQLNGTAEASAGTHTGGAYDVTDPDAGLSNQADVMIGRQMGAAEWARTAAQGFVPHRHGILRGCGHNHGGRYQLDLLRQGYNGLKGNAPDDGPKVHVYRTWKQGIAWAKARQKMRRRRARIKMLREQRAKITSTIQRLLGKKD